MARDEHDRDDLLREATALVERGEWLIPSQIEPVVAGFRRDGCASFFFGAEPVYQFNRAGQLRRAFVEGQLVKAERGKLVGLTRVRTVAESQLVRHPWSDDQTASFCLRALDDLRRFAAALNDPATVRRGQVPLDAPLEQRLFDWLAGLNRIEIATAPNAR